MSAPLTKAATGDHSPAAGLGDLPTLGEPADRGTLTIADKVVERVAGFAVTCVDGASAAPRRLLGINVGQARRDSEAAVTARVDGHTATVHATVAITWPSSIRAVAAQVREQVRADVDRITGLRVAQVDLEVVDLPSDSAPVRRVQ